MLITIDGEEVFTIDAQTLKVLKYYISSDLLKDEIIRRFQWSFTEPYKVGLDNLKTDNIPLLVNNGITNIPIDDNSLIDLITSQSWYQDRKARDDAKIAADATQSQEAENLAAAQAAQQQADFQAAVAAAVKNLQQATPIQG